MTYHVAYLKTKVAEPELRARAKKILGLEAEGGASHFKNTRVENYLSFISGIMKHLLKLKL